MAVINEATRERFFPGSPALGRTLEVDGQDFRVVGVVRNVPFTRLSFSDVWVPISTARTNAYKHDFVGEFIGMILAPDRSSLAAIQQEFDARVATAELPDPKNFTKLTGTAATFFDAMSITIFSPGSGQTRSGWLWACIWAQRSCS